MALDILGGLMAVDMIESGVEKARQKSIDKIVNKADLNKTRKSVDELHTSGGDRTDNVISSASRKVNYENQF